MIPRDPISSDSGSTSAPDRRFKPSQSLRAAAGSHRLEVSKRVSEMRFLVYHYRFSLLLVARSNPLSLNQVRITKRLSFSRRRGFEFPRERQLISSEESIACKIADLTTDRS